MLAFNSAKHATNPRTTLFSAQGRLRDRAARNATVVPLRRGASVSGTKHWRFATLSATAEPVVPASDAEAEANRKRWEEAGNTGSIDEWRWTLNWDKVVDNVIVGSCPRSPADVDVLMQEAGIDAILCLQCDMCHQALNIDWPAIRERGMQRGILVTRVAVRDFDHNDQALMLPEAVRMLHLLLSMGRRVYVHCTAGINRANLTVVGYLTFVKGMSLEDAVHLVKSKRPQAHPYIDCWRTVRGRLVEGRTEEVAGLARLIYSQRQNDGVERHKNADWFEAEEMLIRETFNRQLEAVLSAVDAIKAVQAQQLSLIQSAGSEAAQTVEQLKHSMAEERNKLAVVSAELAQAKQELAALRESNGTGGGVSAVDLLGAARKEITELKAAISEVVQNTSLMLASTTSMIKTFDTVEASIQTAAKSVVARKGAEVAAAASGGVPGVVAQADGPTAAKAEVAVGVVGVEEEVVEKVADAVVGEAADGVDEGGAEEIVEVAVGSVNGVVIEEVAEAAETLVGGEGGAAIVEGVVEAVAVGAVSAVEEELAEVVAEEAVEAAIDLIVEQAAEDAGAFGGGGEQVIAAEVVEVAAEEVGAYGGGVDEQAVAAEGVEGVAGDVGVGVEEGLGEAIGQVLFEKLEDKVDKVRVVVDIGGPAADVGGPAPAVVTEGDVQDLGAVQAVALEVEDVGGAVWDEQDQGNGAVLADEGSTVLVSSSENGVTAEDGGVARVGDV